MDEKNLETLFDDEDFPEPEDVIDYILPDGRIVQIPCLTFEAPRFELEPRENHGMGYHAHIRIRKGGKYHRSGYLVTLQKDV